MAKAWKEKVAAVWRNNIIVASAKNRDNNIMLSWRVWKDSYMITDERPVLYKDIWFSFYLSKKLMLEKAWVLSVMIIMCP